MPATFIDAATDGFILGAGFAAGGENGVHVLAPHQRANTLNPWQHAP